MICDTLLQVSLIFFKAVLKALFNPQTPQGGLYMYLVIRKSPLGDLGVVLKRGLLIQPLLFIFFRVFIWKKLIFTHGSSDFT
jgi:hypothetical protein